MLKARRTKKIKNFSKPNISTLIEQIPRVGERVHHFLPKPYPHVNHSRFSGERYLHIQVTIDGEGVLGLKSKVRRTKVTEERYTKRINRFLNPEVAAAVRSVRDPRTRCASKQIGLSSSHPCDVLTVTSTVYRLPSRRWSKSTSYKLEHVFGRKRVWDIPRKTAFAKLR